MGNFSTIISIIIRASLESPLPVEASFTVIREIDAPPISVKKITCEASRIQVEMKTELSENADSRIVVRGKVLLSELPMNAPGRVETQLSIETDSEIQPTLMIPVVVVIETK